MNHASISDRRDCNLHQLRVNTSGFVACLTILYAVMQVSPMGFGTWAWGNQFLWGYEKSMDAELQEVFNLMVSRGINLFDTADSYGELRR